MWFETHAHLSDSKFDDDRDAVVERAFSSGLSVIVEIADGPTEWPKAKNLAEKYPGKIWWAAGLHPYYADQSSPSLWSELKALTDHPQFVAIGEVGLDYAKCPIPPVDQQRAFQAGIDLSLETKKPLIIHCREAYSDLMPMLRANFKGRDVQPGVIHCFSGNAEQAAELIGMGFYLGVDGPVTYPNANGLREALSAVPNESVVLETDSPYLPPQSFRGKRNEPSYLSQIGAYLASIRRMPASEFAQITSENSRRLFRLNHL